jgi:hypothetical protein
MSVTIIQKYAGYIYLFFDEVLQSKMNDMLLFRILSSNLCDTTRASNQQCRDREKKS